MTRDAKTLPLDTRLRAAGYADLDVILDLWGTMMAEHEANDPRIRLADCALGSYRSYLSYHINNAASRVLLAESGGTPAGFCLVAITNNLKMFLPERYGYLSDLYVQPRARRQGVGRRLVESELAWLAERGVTNVQLQFYQFNKAGEAFWRAMGFEPYYTRMWRDVR
jgi:GNAT superfamily N-acetyltransferase